MASVTVRTKEQQIRDNLCAPQSNHRYNSLPESASFGGFLPQQELDTVYKVAVPGGNPIRSRSPLG